MFYDFNKRIFDYTYSIVEMLYSQVIDSFKSINITELVEEGITIYFSLMNKPRSYSGPRVTTPKRKRAITRQISTLRALPQATQNTPEWFHFRHTRLTASSAWKALDTPAKKNELIYSKCKPIDKAKFSRVNIKSATHHGHKYEPISTMFYENKFNTTIEEFGCIPDSKASEFGASPDGINVDPDSERYGYLLEIKNPVSRVLTGIPKREYWVQMQFQMRVTGLHTCDFLETVFKEYKNDEEFHKDGSFNISKEGKHKGVIVCFNNGNKPVYMYSPWNCTKNDFDTWYDKLLDEDNNLTWIQNIYWRMDEYSCVTVPYNEKWFDAAEPAFKDIWKTIEAERISGYGHRKPKRRTRKAPIRSPQISPAADEVVPSMFIPPPKLVLKIKTETFKQLNNSNS